MQLHWVANQVSKVRDAIQTQIFYIICWEYSKCNGNHNWCYFNIWFNIEKLCWIIQMFSQDPICWNEMQAYSIHHCRQGIFSITLNSYFCVFPFSHERLYRHSTVISSSFFVGNNLSGLEDLKWHPDPTTTTTATQLIFHPLETLLASLGKGNLCL